MAKWPCLHEHWILRGHDKLGHAYCQDCASLIYLHDVVNRLNERVKEIERQLAEAKRPNPYG